VIRNRSFYIVLALLIGANAAWGQNFRGVVDRFDLPEPNSIHEATLTGGTVAVIDVSGDRRFTSGINVRIRSRSSVPIQPGQFTVALYSAVDAPDESGVVTLAGSLIDRFPVTNASTIEIVVPFAGYTAPAVPAGTRNVNPIDPTIGAIGIQLVPSGKGMSSETMSTEFSIEVAPVLRPVGGIFVELNGEPDVVADALERLSLEIDGNSVEVGQVIEVPPGIYRLTANADDLLSYTANVGVERASIREVTLTVERPRARVRLSVPSVADVFWNGERTTGSTLSVEPGIHTVLIRLGDFSLSRQLELEPDGDYEVGVDLDILLKQN
jgi:hypothetical protein